MITWVNVEQVPAINNTVLQINKPFLILPFGDTNNATTKN